MTQPAPQALPRVVCDSLHVVQKLAGRSTDIYRIRRYNCVNFPPSHTRFEESALKVIRVTPTDHNQIEGVDNVLMAFLEHLLAERAAYTHPNIAPMTVVSMVRAESEPVTSKALLSPWYSGGSVLEYVKTYPAVDRLSLLIEVGGALEHLHSHDVAHGAIHPSNILINNNGRVVVTDTGIHTLMSRFMFIPSGRLPISLSAIYQPAEQLCPATDVWVQPIISMDVFSFATTAWAIFAGKNPFFDLSRFHTIAQVVMEINLHGHQRLVKPSNMSAELWAILQNCLTRDPVLRPIMTEVVTRLESLSQ